MLNKYLAIYVTTRRGSEWQANRPATAPYRASPGDKTFARSCKEPAQQLSADVSGGKIMSEASVFYQPAQESRMVPTGAPAPRPVNVGTLERWASLIGGGALVLYGLRRSLGSLAVAVGGGALIYRALTGHCPVYQAMGTDTTHSSVPTATSS